MYGNNFMLDRLTRQKQEIENLINSYQNQQQPMNIFNVGNTQIDFEARIVGKYDNAIMMKDISNQLSNSIAGLSN